MNGLYLAGAGAAAEIKALDVVAQNLVNSATPGFRKFETLISSVGAGLPSWQYPQVADPPPISLAQGPIRNTGDPHDVALIGSAFIRVQTADGTEAYTRNGELQVSPEGTLLAAGQPVLKAGGGTLVVPPGPIEIAADGSVSVNGVLAGRISLADPVSSELTPSGSSLYVTRDGTVLPEAETGTIVRQGFVEDPAVNAVGGSLALAGIMRSYESAMKAVQAIDENQDRTIQGLTVNA